MKIARASMPIVPLAEVKVLDETNEPEKTMVHLTTTLD
jgi:hypothetical protein